MPRIENQVQQNTCVYMHVIFESLCMILYGLVCPYIVLCMQQIVENCEVIAFADSQGAMEYLGRFCNRCCLFAIMIHRFWTGYGQWYDVYVSMQVGNISPWKMYTEAMYCLN